MMDDSAGRVSSAHTAVSGLRSNVYDEIFAKLFTARISLEPVHC